MEFGDYPFPLSMNDAKGGTERLPRVFGSFSAFDVTIDP